MSPKDKKRLHDNFMKAVDARPDAQRHFPHKFYEPCESVHDHYERYLATDAYYNGIEKALALIAKWKKEDGLKP